MIRGLSHLVVATSDVPKLSQFFQSVFELKPYYSHEAFTEFVLLNKARIAFFLPVGKAAEFFNASSSREAVSFGVTVDDVDKIYERTQSLNLKVSGPPKDHPWGERSFLLIDPDGNRWEITKSPSAEGHLVNK